MTIAFVCASCKAKLNIPDNMAGKRAKCPKCQEVFTIPNREASSHEVGQSVANEQSANPKPATTPAAATATSKPVSTPKQSAAPLAASAAVPASVGQIPAAASPVPTKQSLPLSPLILVAAGGVLVLFLGVATIVVWFVLSGRQPNAVQAKATEQNNQATPADLSGATNPPPVATSANESAPVAQQSPAPAVTPSILSAQWFDFADEKMGFKASFPASPEEDEVQEDPKEEGITAEFKREMVKSMKEKGQLRMVKATHGNRQYFAQATALPLVGMSAKQYFDRIEPSVGTLNPGFELVGKGVRGKHAGHDFCDFTLQQGSTQKIVRMIPAQGIIYGLSVQGNGITSADSDVRRFFDSLQLSEPKKPERVAPAVAANVPANGESPVAPPNSPATETPMPEKPQNSPAAAPPEPAVPLGAPFAGKKTQFTICFPEGAVVKTLDTVKAFEDAKRRNEIKKRWADEKALYETFSAEVDGRTYLVTAWRDRELTGNDANNAQLRRIRDVLADELKGNSKPSIVNSDLLKKVTGRSLYTRRYRRDGKLVVYQEVREGAFSCVLHIECPTDVNERTDPLIWAFFNSLEATP